MIVAILLRRKKLKKNVLKLRSRNGFLIAMYVQNNIMDSTWLLGKKVKKKKEEKKTVY